MIAVKISIDFILCNLLVSNDNKMIVMKKNGAIGFIESFATLGLGFVFISDSESRVLNKYCF